MTTDDDTNQDTSSEDFFEPDTRLVAQVRGQMQRLGGRVYQVKLENVDVRSLLELLRCLRDIEHDKDAAVRRARTEPWRR